MTDEEQALFDQLPLEVQVIVKFHMLRRPAQTPPDPLPTIWLLLAGRGAGKLLDVETPIPTPAGFVRLGDLAPGDEVFDEAGTPCRVTAVYDAVPERAWELTFSDHSTIVAGGEHLWLTRDQLDRKRGRPGEVRTTDQIAASITRGPRGDLNHSIPVCGPLTLPEAALPLDSWLLGYWLGNGTTMQGSVTVPDQDAHLLERFDLGVRQPGRSCFTVNVRGLQSKLRSLGLLGDKHVPDAYLWASESQRLALLRGLMDSDGYADERRNNVEFSSMKEGLAEAVLLLARGLGEKPVLAKGRATLNGVDLGVKFRVAWRPARHVPFSPGRKAERISPLAAQGRRITQRMITAAVPVVVRPMRCLTVDSPSHLFLAGKQMIPTHNTWTAANWAFEWCHELSKSWVDKSKPIRVALVGETFDDVVKTMIDGETGLRSVVPRSLELAWNRTYGEYKFRFANGVEVHCFAYASERPEKLRGPQHHCFVAGTLVQTPVGPRPIETIEVGDLVETRFGPRRVSAIGSRSASLVRVEHDGADLIGTPDHPVWVVDRGWTRLDSINPGDTLVSWRDERTGSSTSGVTPTTTSTGRRSGATVAFGKTSTARSPRSTKSIISTRSPATISLRTSNASRLATIVAFMPLGVSRRSVAAAALPSSSRGSEPRPSTVQPASTRPLRPLVTGTITSATPAATSSATSAPTPGSVARAVSTAGVGVVFNLTVEKSPEYFANGILVHNCAWIDEPAKFKDADADPELPSTTFSNLWMGLRLGEKPHLIVTGTPTPCALVKFLWRSPDVATSKMNTFDNAENLPAKMVEGWRRADPTGRFYRQELAGEIIWETPDGLFPISIIDQDRRVAPLNLLKVLGYDPAMSANAESDESGIVLGGYSPEETVSVNGVTTVSEPLRAYPLKDLSGHFSPAKGTQLVIETVLEEQVEVLVVEQNQGVDFVITQIRQALKEATESFTMRELPKKKTAYGSKRRWRIATKGPEHLFEIQAIHASSGKVVRAQGASIAYEHHQVHHPIEGLLKLEEQQTTYSLESKFSPDRLDAWVYCLLYIFGESITKTRPAKLLAPVAVDVGSAPGREADLARLMALSSLGGPRPSSIWSIDVIPKGA